MDKNKIYDENELNEATKTDVEESKNKAEFATVRTNSFCAGLYDWIYSIVFTVAIAVVILTFIFRVVDVEGSSMDDTLHTSDKVVVTNLFYQPKNNDIVVISHGAKYDTPIIKRVIATEGQTIKLDYENEKIIVDGMVINEPYIKETTFSGNFGNTEIPEVVPDGKVFVMGDNRKVSLDSRSSEIGLIDVENVIGKAQFVIYPFNEAKYLY